jgi:hypothetical protein
MYIELNYGIQEGNQNTGRLFILQVIKKTFLNSFPR